MDLKIWMFTYSPRLEQTHDPTRSNHLSRQNRIHIRLHRYTVKFVPAFKLYVLQHDEQ